MLKGAQWAIEQGFGNENDLQHTENYGYMEEANPDTVSDRARQRGLDQVGTLGSGNHFLEIGVIDKIFDEQLAQKLLLEQDQVIVIVHSGSRGFGYQVCDDFLHQMVRGLSSLPYKIPDRQLACAPASSKEGQDYFGAMKCAVNYSFTNRLIMTQWIRETFAKVFNRDWESMDMHTVYGLCHNVVKLEDHIVNGEKRKLFVHRKGATRSFPDQPVHESAETVRLTTILL